MTLLILVLSLAHAHVPRDRIQANLKDNRAPWAQIILAQLLEAEDPEGALELYQGVRERMPGSPHACAGVARVHQTLGIDELPEACAVPVVVRGYTHVYSFAQLVPATSMPGIGPAPGIEYIQVITGSRYPTPIVLPLTDEPLTHTLARTTPATFDLDGDGEGMEWEWLDPAAAWLVWGAEVEDGTQLFGSYTWGLHWQSGYHVLVALDDDHNGWLEGDELDGLSLWADGDADGVWRPEEEITLAEREIAAIGVSYVLDPFSDSLYPIAPAGVRFTDGTTRETVDWTLLPRGEHVFELSGFSLGGASYRRDLE